MSDFQKAYSLIKSSVVGLGIYKKENQKIIGTGFFINETGWILTNRHIIKEMERLKDNTNDLCAYLFPESNSQQGLVGTSMFPVSIKELVPLEKPIKSVSENVTLNGRKADVIIPPPEIDLGLCKINPEDLLKVDMLPINPVSICNSKNIHIGQEIGFFGFPLGVEFSLAKLKSGYPNYIQFTPILQVGHVSAILPYSNAETQLDIVVDHVIVGGSSGSPIFDSEGKVFGVIRSTKRERIKIYQVHNNSENRIENCYGLSPAGLGLAVPSSQFPKKCPWGDLEYCDD